MIVVTPSLQCSNDSAFMQFVTDRLLLMENFSLGLSSLHDFDLLFPM